MHKIKGQLNVLQSASIAKEYLALIRIQIWFIDLWSCADWSYNLMAALCLTMHVCCVSPTARALCVYRERLHLSARGQQKIRARLELKCIVAVGGCMTLLGHRTTAHKLRLGKTANVQSFTKNVLLLKNPKIHTFMQSTLRPFIQVL